MTPTLQFFPLMAGQMDFWQEWREQPERAVSTVAHALRLTGNVDSAALTQAITATLAETDVAALRLRVGADGQPQQAVDPALRPALRCIDLTGDPQADRTAAAMMQADLEAPLDLLGVMSAQWLIRLPGGAAIWYLRGHHLFLDGYAMALIETRCAAHYAALTGGPPAGPGFAPFADLLAEDRAARDSARHAADRDWWRAQLAATPSLPVLQRGQEDYAAEPHLAELDLAHLAPALRDMATRYGIGWPDLLTLLAGLWLSDRMADATGATTIWLPWMGRLGSVAARVPAMVVNILPLRVAPAADTSLAEALRDLTAALRQLRRHGRYRVEDISRDLGLGDQRRFFFSPLVNVMPFDPPVFPGCHVAREVLAAGPGDGTNLTFAATARGDGLTAEIAADPALTSPAAFARLHEGLDRFLARAADPAADARPWRALLADDPPYGTATDGVGTGTGTGTGMGMGMD